MNRTVLINVGTLSSEPLKHTSWWSNGIDNFYLKNVAQNNTTIIIPKGMIQCTHDTKLPTIDKHVLKHDMHIT